MQQAEICFAETHPGEQTTVSQCHWLKSSRLGSKECVYKKDANLFGRLQAERWLWQGQQLRPPLSQAASRVGSGRGFCFSDLTPRPLLLGVGGAWSRSGRNRALGDTPQGCLPGQRTPGGGRSPLQPPRSSSLTQPCKCSVSQGKPQGGTESCSLTQNVQRLV